MADGLYVIAGSDELYRLIFPDYVRKDGTISAAAFMRGGQPAPEISVNVAHLTNVEATLAPKRGRGHRLGVLTAQAPRDLGLEVIHNPLGPKDPGGPNDAHALIKGAYSRGQCSELARMVRLIDYTA